MIDLAFIIVTYCVSSIGISVSLILLFGQSVPTLSSKILSGLLFCLVVIAIGNILLYTDFYLKYPAFYKTYAWAPFCLGPLSYLYVKKILYQSIKLNKVDYLLFLPAVIFVVNRIPYFLLSSQEQLQVIKNILINENLYVKEPEGLFPQGWVAILRVSFLLVFILASFLELMNWRQKIYNSKLHINRNKHIYHFLWMLTSFMLLGAVIAFLNTFLLLKSGHVLVKLLLTCVLSEIVLISAYLYLNPTILYGMIGWYQVNRPVRLASDSKENDKTIDGNHMTINNGRVILKAIENQFKNHHSFTTTGYTIHKLSEEISTPTYLLSTVINQEFGKNFNEFINDARINYLKTFKENDPNFDNYSIEYIGNAIGFASRTSFIAAVKKRTGLTPKEYLSKL
ncbi:helix-turn-helix domain-containing protein [Aquirufa aurantiipilula]